MYVDRKKEVIFPILYPPNLNYQSQKLTLRDVKVSGGNKAEESIKSVFGPFI